MHAALGKLHRLEEEEPQLHVVWNETLGEIHVQLMGEIQLEVPAENIGRAMSDIQRMEGTFDPPESGEETAVLTGFAPVSTIDVYKRQIHSIPYSVAYRWRAVYKYYSFIIRGTVLQNGVRICKSKHKRAKLG